jgi:hypothetical protein
MSEVMKPGGSFRPGSQAAPEWYSRSTIDEFLSAAEVQRAELQARIAEANARAERARAATGLHRLMATMLLDTQRELSTIRRQAEAQAAELMSVAPPAPEPVRAVAAEDDVAIAEVEPDNPLSIPPPTTRANGKDHDAQTGDDEFIAFLRAGLADTAPHSDDDESEATA